MAYSDFTVTRVKQDFDIQTLEGQSFLSHVINVVPSQTLIDFLAEALPLASMLKSEKAKSELIISPILLEVRRQLNRQVSLFSGEEFNVEAEIGLSGICDFLISQSTEQLEVEAPAIIIVEAKKADINTGMGQCMAAMVAAQRFNQKAGKPLKSVFGCVSSGLLWRFLKLEQQQIAVDAEDFGIKPIDRLLGILIWMAAQRD
jgi:hypothetical protein